MSVSIQERPVAAAADGTSPLYWRTILAVVAVFGLLFQLGSRGLNEPDEGRYAAIGREMAATGSYLVPRLNGLLHLSKPPLTYWLIALSVKVFGATEFAARLPATLAALATLLAVFLLARSAGGETHGLWAAAVLVSTGMFFVVARLITTDMILTCCVTWSVWWLWRWYISTDRSWRKILWFYVFLGCGMLTKGPVAVALPLFALAGLCWRNPGLPLRQLGWGRGTLVVLAIAAPWFVAVAALNPGVWHYFVVREVFERVATTVHGRVKPWWYFFPVLAGGFLPWTAFLPALGTLRPTTGRRGDLLRLCAAWAILGFGLFTVSQSKLPTYVVPLLPPLAVLVAAVLAENSGSASAGRTGMIVWRCAVAAVVLFALAAMAIGFVTRREYGVTWPYVVAVFGAAAAGAAGCVWFGWRRRTGPLAGLLALTALVVFLAVAWAFPSFERNLAGKTPAKYLAARIRLEDPGQQAVVLTYNTFPRGLPFYLQRPILWYHQNTHGPADVFEFNAVHGGAATALADRAQVRALLAGPQRAFCVATLNKFATIQTELNLRLYPLEETGDWLLLSNQPATAPTAPVGRQSR